MGSIIEPESFDSVTIFFSDVVRFSELSRQSTALQAIIAYIKLKIALIPGYYAS
jgi:class 3 adenylate cyclase